LSFREGRLLATAEESKRRILLPARLTGEIINVEIHLFIWNEITVMG
jgi:hypothetical protein